MCKYNLEFISIYEFHNVIISRIRDKKTGTQTQLKLKKSFFVRSQSYDRELQRKRCKKIYNAARSLVRYENKNILFDFIKML
jgi:hypothetical protein